MWVSMRMGFELYQMHFHYRVDPMVIKKIGITRRLNLINPFVPVECVLGFPFPIIGWAK